MPKLQILYEDNHCIVVDKPNNLPVQADSSGDADLLNMVKEYVKERYNKPGTAYIGLVHRLDRPAGGLVVLARTSKAAARLSAQVRSRELGRQYLLVVRGEPKMRSGEIKNYLLKDTAANMVRIVPAATEGAKEAVLNYRLLQTVHHPSEGKLSLIEASLQTGRSHQIRVQMAGLGCPLYGDQKYGSDLNKKGQQLALHAAKLTFIHPTLKDKRTFISYPPQKAPWTYFRINTLN